MFIVDKLCPFEKPFHKLELRRVSFSKTIDALGFRPRALISFLVFGNPDETLALVYEILLLSQIMRHFISGLKNQGKTPADERTWLTPKNVEGLVFLNGFGLLFVSNCFFPFCWLRKLACCQGFN